MYSFGNFELNWMAGVSHIFWVTVLGYAVIRHNQMNVKTVFTEIVNNKSIPIVITTNGNLVAKNKIELYSEVQGILETSSKEFKQGTFYSKGETIIKINSDEFYSNLFYQDIICCLKIVKT